MVFKCIGLYVSDIVFAQIKTSKFRLSTFKFYYIHIYHPPLILDGYETAKLLVLHAL